jgi:hypothetical protein
MSSCMTMTTHTEESSVLSMLTDRSLDQAHHIDGGSPPAEAWEIEPTAMPPDDFDDDVKLPGPAEAIDNESPSASSVPVPAVVSVTWTTDWSPIARWYTAERRAKAVTAKLKVRYCM